MRESKFIAQNKEKWSEFETIFEQKDKDSNKLSKLFIQITDDLSYARTFYPNRSVRYYINGLAQKVFSSIYKKPKHKKGRLSYFLFEEMPAIIYESRKNFFVASLFFFIAFSIGFLSSHYDKNFTEQILGADYVVMTKNNIAKKDPMAVYKQEEENKFMMAFGITLNNIRVACYAFISGIFFGIVTLYLLLSNGIMLGAFEFLFFDAHIMKEAFLAVFLHGMLEISSIIIAGAAGLTLAKGLLFPGTYTRMQALQISGQKGLKILLTTIPLFIMAGTIEGFLTRYTNVPDFIRLLFIVICLVFILGYYLWLPFQKWKTGNLIPLNNEKIISINHNPIELFEIKEIGKIFSETFKTYQINFERYLKLSIWISLIYTIVAFGIQKMEKTGNYVFNSLIFNDLRFSLYYKETNVFVVLNLFLFITSIFICFYLFHHTHNKAYKNISFTKFIFKNKIFVLLSIIVGFIINEYLYSYNGLTLICFFSPLLLLFTGMHGAIECSEKSISGSLTGYKQSFSRIINILFVYLIMLFMVAMVCIITIMLGSLFSEFITTNMPEVWKNGEDIGLISYLFFTALPIMLGFPLLIFSQGLLYYSHREMYESVNLSQRLAKLGKQKKKYGY